MWAPNKPMKLTVAIVIRAVAPQATVRGTESEF